MKDIYQTWQKNRLIPKYQKKKKPSSKSVIEVEEKKATISILKISKISVQMIPKENELMECSIARYNIEAPVKFKFQ